MVGKYLFIVTSREQFQIALEMQDMWMSSCCRGKQLRRSVRRPLGEAE